MESYEKARAFNHMPAQHARHLSDGDG